MIYIEIVYRGYVLNRIFDQKPLILYLDSRKGIASSARIFQEQE